MKPLHSIETPETRLGTAGDTACRTRRLPASASGAPFLLLPSQPPGKGAADQRLVMAGTCKGHLDVDLATPPVRVRRPMAHDNILLETGELQ
jgi:hypothetical protein